jgi:hypothetical protein
LNDKLELEYEDVIERRRRVPRDHEKNRHREYSP